MEAAALVKDLRATIKAGEGLGSVEEEPQRMGNACSFRLLSQLGETKQRLKAETRLRVKAEKELMRATERNSLNLIY